MPYSTLLDNSCDTLYSRDIMSRIEELKEERFAWIHERIGDQYLPDQFVETLALWEKDHELEAMELDSLTKLAEEGEGYADDWHDGVTLIRESYFAEYCEELLTECGDIPANLPHYVVIDWERTSEYIMEDYTGIDFDGVTYYIR